MSLTTDRRLRPITCVFDFTKYLFSSRSRQNPAQSISATPNGNGPLTLTGSSYECTRNVRFRFCRITPTSLAKSSFAPSAAEPFRRGEADRGGSFERRDAELTARLACREAFLGREGRSAGESARERARRRGKRDRVPASEGAVSLQAVREKLRGAGTAKGGGGGGYRRALAVRSVDSSRAQVCS